MILVFVAGCPSKKKENTFEPKKNETSNFQEDFLQDFKSKFDDNPNYKDVFVSFDKAMAYYLITQPPELIKNKKEKNRNLKNKMGVFVGLLSDIISEYPERCSLYNLRGYISAIAGTRDDFLFNNADMLENFDLSDWSAKILIAYSYFQKYDDNKALSYIDSALTSYCNEELGNDCSGSSKDLVFKVINDWKRSITKEQEEVLFDISKYKLDNHDNCYFMETNAKNKEGESVSWSGKCKDGWAEGKGELVYEKSGNRIKVFMKKGFMSGKIKITFISGNYATGKAKNSIPVGRWKVFNKGDEVIQDVYRDEKGRVNGEGFYIVYSDDNLSVKFHGEYKNNFPVRGGKLTCQYKGEAPKEKPYVVHRFTMPDEKRLNHKLQPLCGLPGESEEDWKNNENLFKIAEEKELNRIKKIIKNKNLDGNNCTVEKGFNFVADYLEKMKKEI